MRINTEDAYEIMSREGTVERIREHRRWSVVSDFFYDDDEGQWWHFEWEQEATECQQIDRDETINVEKVWPLITTAIEYVNKKPDLHRCQ